MMDVMTEVDARTVDSPSISPHVMEKLAVRLRPAGLYLLLLSPEGSIVWHDAEAGMFFSRYVLPMLRYDDRTGESLEDLADRVRERSGIHVSRPFCGAAVVAAPYLERHRMTGIVVLAGRSRSFELGEDVLRACGRLGLDATWLRQQAQRLPTYSNESLKRQTKILVGMVHDQVRLMNMEVELESLSEQLANTYEELSLIYQLNGGMKVNRPVSAYFKRACLDLLEVMGVRGMGVTLRGGAAEMRDPVLYGRLSLPPGQVQRLAGALMCRLADRHGALLINDLAQDRSFAWLGGHAERLLAVGFVRHEKLLGCLFALDKENGDFDSVDSKLLGSIANETAIYLENATLFEDVHGLMMGLLHSLTSAVDAKDPYTCGHSERVALLSRELSQRAGLPEAEMERVYMAGLLHDVGKIGVPERVLQKTGQLTAEEFDEMKKHPEIGARILRDIRQISDLIPGVLHHHERYDGKGYPHGLRERNIPRMGRIICLSDSFDAMTSSRTYREAMSLEEALLEIRNCAGTQFDPELAELFMGIGVERLRELLRVHREEGGRRIDLAEASSRRA